MSCPSRRQLQAFLDESLAAKEMSEVSAHVDQCDTCLVSLDELSEAESFFDLEDDVSFPIRSGRSILDVDEQSAVDALIERMQIRSDETLDATMMTGAEVTSFADSALELPSRIGHYELLKVVGEGATGRLYRALDLQLDRIVAVKTLKSELAALPSARARFDREARTCAALRHDHIVAVYQVDSGDGYLPPYLVMEFVEGGSLQARLRSAEKPELRQMIEWIRQAALALQAAHDAGIVHRDIKPSNLLIDDTTNRLRVADFGLARLVEAEESLTAEGMIAGTPAYMSPEQIVDATTVNGLSDIYSLGVILYEVLTGEIPFRGIVRMVLNQVLHEEPVPPGRLNDHIPRDLENICLKAMSKERRLRYQTAGAFADDLQRWLEGKSVLARPVSSVRKVARWCRRNPRPAGVAAIVGAVLLGGAVDWKQYDRVRERERNQAESVRDAFKARAEIADAQRDRALRALEILVQDLRVRIEADPDHAIHEESVFVTVTPELERLAADTMEAGNADLATAVAQSRIGAVFLSLGREASAVEMFQAAAKNARQTVQSGVRATAGRQVLAWSLLKLGDVDSRAGRDLDARGYYEEAVDQSQLVLQSATDRSNTSALRLKAGRDLSLAVQRLGGIDERDGRATEAASRYLIGIQQLNDLLVDFPSSTELHRDIGVLKLKLARQAVAAGKGSPVEYFKDAHVSFRRALELAGADQRAARDLAFSYGELGAWLLEKERFDEASEFAQEERDMLAELCESNPLERDFLRRHAECCLRLGTVEARRSRWGESETSLNQARSRFEQLTLGSPTSIRDQILLGECDLLLATAEIATDRKPAAKSRLTELSMRLAALKIDPDRASARELELELYRLNEQLTELMAAISD